MGFQGGSDPAHRRYQTENGFVIVRAEDFVSDEEVSDFDLGVKGRRWCGPIDRLGFGWWRC